ncbi:MAG: ribose-5-phosphate isomerase RpiA [Gammaproteobacteria bacterium]|nr:ribose-5-phosphate isomerase RpiA [Gammaproteobacteria bacterium]MCP4089196.1 ribose-5-phosphate isomerase RpiA [Gammaproteobacteria bacterium]MCP4276780.1 ribose-5-phosphate isomerase RpiA [Gammaproteobacteria bacterium]MCP4830623.1 ribose-5-phosphate isomerase RpiA [Gammaproteobacteria bacterium]MCP4928432.1 ribose-5-phosphate isomerase RpiA [Gammaproteobacteria bacterium]
MHQSEKKRQAALAALEYIEDNTQLGVGTGSTVNYFIDALPDYRSKICSVASSSEASTKRLQKLGFEVSSLGDTGELDLYVDGADEANKHFHLIKGGGGALTREKVVAAYSRKFICIIDDTKLVGTLGAFPLPVEVIPMARAYIAKKFIKLRGQPIYREGFKTDNGNHILDIYNLNIINPVEMEDRINRIPGVVTVGIFAHRGADIILMADNKQVHTLRK